MGSIPIGSTMTPKQLGILGEKIACRYLKSKGYQILDRNYFFKISGSPQKGEIDIIAKRENTISFVEVKTLSETYRELTSTKISAISPEMKVNFQKQKKIIKTAESWLRKKKIPLHTRWQVDIISVRVDLNSKKARIRYFKNV